MTKRHFSDFWHLTIWHDFVKMSILIFSSPWRVDALSLNINFQSFDILTIWYDIVKISIFIYLSSWWFSTFWQYRIFCQNDNFQVLLKLKSCSISWKRQFTCVSLLHFHMLLYIYFKNINSQLVIRSLSPNQSISVSQSVTQSISQLVSHSVHQSISQSVQ